MRLTGMQRIWLALVLVTLISQLALSGCASQVVVPPSEPVPLPAVLSEPQSDGAKIFYTKVLDFLEKAQTFLDEMQQLTTTSSKP